MKRNLKHFNAAFKSIGQSCPVCGSTETLSTDSAIDSSFYIKYMGCWECDARWENIYEFVDIRIIHDRKIPTGNTDNSSN